MEGDLEKIIDEMRGVASKEMQESAFRPDPQIPDDANDSSDASGSDDEEVSRELPPLPSDCLSLFDTDPTGNINPKAFMSWGLRANGSSLERTTSWYCEVFAPREVARNIDPS